MAELICPDCGNQMLLKSSRFGKFFGCVKYPDCTGTHGAHPDGTPLGIPATKEVKLARIRAHAKFDTLWKGGGMTRTKAYEWMMSALSISREEAHIGMFDGDRCERLIQAVEKYLGS